MGDAEKGGSIDQAVAYIHNLINLIRQSAKTFFFLE